MNPYEYQGAKSPSQNFPDEDAYNAALIAEFKRLGIGLVAVTDHWCVESADSLIQACEAEGITALPGFEANTSEGIHLIALFPEGTSLAEVNAAIGACGATPSCASGTPGKPFVEIVEEVSRRSGLVVAAHVNAPSGLLKATAGQPLATMWKHDQLHAVAVSPGLALDANEQAILDNKSPLCRRPHAVAVLHADDICHPDRLSQSGGTTWLKASAASLDGLRMAVRTPSTRISLLDPGEQSHPVLVAVSWQGGFLDDVSIRFNPSLNALIGGRGTGKSTVVESLRFALGLEPIGAAAQRDHQSFIQKVLTDGTTVQLLVEAVHPSKRHLLIERTVGARPVVRDMAGSVLAQTPLEVLGAVEIFSQHELAELAEDRAYVARLLERFAPPASDADAVRLVREGLSANRREQLVVLDQIATLESELTDLPKLEERKASYLEAGLDGQLEEQSVLQAEERLVLTAQDRVSAAAESLKELKSGLSVDSNLSSASTGDRFHRVETLGEMEAVLAGLNGAIEKALADVATAISSATTSLETLRAKWEAETADVKARYGEVVRELKAKGLEPSAFLETTKRIDQLKAKEATLADARGALERLRDRRRQLLADNHRLWTEERRRLGSAATAANDLVKGMVVVRPVASPDRSRIERLIQDQVSGQRTKILAAAKRSDFSPQAFVAACREGVDSLRAKYDITGAQATALVAAGERLFLELEEELVGLAAEAQLNVSDGGTNYKPLEELSKGQKATALLLLLLTSAHSPLVIDQPEDNLDNRFVFDGVVPRLRSLKGDRQLVFSTHNANVPVLGDAELVVAMESSGERGRVAADGAGSIDDPVVRDLAGELLEGGREAFDARRHVYGY